MAIENSNGFPVRVADSTPLAALVAPAPVIVNSPVTWPQLIWGTISDYLNPGVLLPGLLVIANWLQSSEPLTTRGLVTAVVLAGIAIEQALIKMSGNDGLS